MRMIGRMALALCVTQGFAATARATDGVVASPNCNEAGFNSVLAAVDGSGGGTITFNCGATTGIVFTNYKQVAHAVTIDGGGTMTLSGGNTSAFFQVFGTANLVLRRLILESGAYSSTHALENFGNLRLDQVTMRNNGSTAAPILNQNHLVIERSTFSANGNIGTGTNGRGGVLLNDGGVATIRYSTFTGNAATMGGGAIYTTSDIHVSNSTFTGNRTTSGGSGGGAIFQNGGASTIVYSTIAENTGQTFGGGFYNSGSGGSTLTISRSIISNNTGGNCDGVSTSGGYNLWFGATSCPYSAAGDGNGDPKLGVLAGNGGPTQTMVPLTGSAAIGRIPNAQCMIPVDQRGGGRPSGVGCDSGAVEVGATLDLIFYDGFE